MNSLLSLRASIAEILALSVLDLFPGAFLGDFHTSDTQFTYLFHFKQPKHPELLPLLEEKMRGVIKSQPLIEEVEMAAVSAIHYFDHREQPFKREMVSHAEKVILPMVRIGNFYDFVKVKPYSGDFSGVAFQLLEAKELEKEREKWIEISGTAFFNKEELKSFIRHRKAWLKAKPWEAAERFLLSCPVEGETALLPKGVELFQALERFWRQSIQSQGEFREVVTRNSQLYPLLAERLKGGLAEWATSDSGSTDPIDLCYFLSPEQQLRQKCISSLQFIKQTFNMLRLNADWVLCEKNDADIHSKHRKKEVLLLKTALEACGFSYTVQATESCSESCFQYAFRSYVELRVYDSLGESWPGPFLSVSLASSLASVKYSLLGPVKRLIALLAESIMAEEASKDRESQMPFKWPDCLSRIKIEEES